MTDRVRLGPFTLDYLPDGDDPGVGLLRITSATATAEMQATRREWRVLLASVGRR